MRPIPSPCPRGSLSSRPNRRPSRHPHRSFRPRPPLWPRLPPFPRRHLLQPASPPNPRPLRCPALTSPFRTVSPPPHLTSFFFRSFFFFFFYFFFSPFFFFFFF